VNSKNKMLKIIELEIKTGTFKGILKLKNTKLWRKGVKILKTIK